MYHILFMILHVLAILFGVIGLVVTIPLHIICAISWAAWRDTVAFITTKTCPYCRKKVGNEASKCPYCQECLSQSNEVKEVETAKKETTKTTGKVYQKSLKNSKKGRDNKSFHVKTMREKKQQLVPLFPDEEEAEEVENIIETSFEGYVLVKHGGVFHMVYFEGESPQILSWEEVRNLPQLQKWCDAYFN